MPANPDYQYAATYIDRSGEKSVAAIHYDPDTVDLATKLGALLTAIDGVSNMVLTVVNQGWAYRYTNVAYGNGQREQKYLVTMQDNTDLSIFSFTIPGRDDTAVQTVPGTDFYNLADAGLMAALVGAIQAVAVSPNGNTSTVMSIRAVGRNI